MTALFLASKYEEIYPNSIADFAYITADTYTAAQIRKKEMDMLRKLDYRLGRPTPLLFLRRYSKLMNTTKSVHCLAKYFLELCYLSTTSRALLPSQCAVGALVLSRRVVGSGGGGGGKGDCNTESIWDHHMEQYTFYLQSRAVEFSERLLACVLSCRKELSSSSITDKYRDQLGHLSFYPKLRQVLELLSGRRQPSVYSDLV